MNMAQTATNNLSGIVEVDLVFPRNETYEIAEILPVVFAFQNAELAASLNPTIGFQINALDVHIPLDTRWLNYTATDPVFESYPVRSINKEGTWELQWYIDWNHCNGSSSHGFTDAQVLLNYTWNSIVFSTKKDGKKVDLVAATEDEKCDKELGFAVEVEYTMEVPQSEEWAHGHQCAVLKLPNSTATPDPCRVKIDEKTKESLEARMHTQECNSARPPNDCDDKSVAQRLKVGDISLAMILVGVLGQFIV